MKKIFALFALFLMLPVVHAGILADNIKINRIRFGDYGYVQGPDTGVRIRDGECYGKSFMTPVDGLHGEYLVRVSVSSGGVRRVKYRYIFIE